eukprot:Skav221181  [mRNA]  locus=scaffold1504:51167:57162:- [translate_table: standard]
MNQGWSGELCLAKLTTASDTVDAAVTMRRAVAVAKLAGRPNVESHRLGPPISGSPTPRDARSPDGWNALMWSAQRGNTEDCRVLLEARASANAVSSDGTSPLLCAVRADVAPIEVVKLLLAYRADPALVPMQSPFDEYVTRRRNSWCSRVGARVEVDMDVREALASAPKQR